MSKELSGPPRFIFIELLDPEVNALLGGLRLELGGDAPSASIHITVRGPYQRPISAREIELYELALRSSPLLIHGIGTFQNSDEHVVYIRVSSSELKKVWWKPDYPSTKYGVNPHVTLLKTSDRKFASVVRAFLVKEDLKLVCHTFRLVPYTSKQVELFPAPKPPQDTQFLELANRRLVRPDILQRAANLVRSYASGVE